MNATTNIRMDLSKPDIGLSVNAVQGDAYSRTLRITLNNGLQPWIIPEDACVAVRYRKPDKTNGYYDTLPDGTAAWSIQENILTIRLAPQMLTVAGTVTAQIELIQGLHTLSTFSLNVYVEANPAAGALKSETYINWLQWLQEQSDAQVQIALQAAATSTTNAERTEAAAANAERASASAEAIAKGVAAIVAGNEAYTKQESHALFSPVIVETASGVPIVVTDSADAPIQGLKLCGKTVQDGTPTPESPTELIGAGNNGSITVSIGKSGENTVLQTFTVSTPNGLPGIPVPSGGNYTDGTGQQWVCDEVDFARGKYVQRVATIEYDGSSDETWNVVGTPVARHIISGITPAPKPAVNEVSKAIMICSHFEITSYSGLKTATINSIAFNSATSYTTLGIVHQNYKSETDTTAFRAWLSENPITVMYAIANPIEVNLAADVLADYAAAHTYNPNTTITNDAGAFMEVQYAADTKRYIDNQIQKYKSQS